MIELRPTEAPANQIQQVVDQLRVLLHDQVKPHLDAKSAVDPLAGIIIAKLDSIEPMVAPDGQAYGFYAARVLPPSPDNPNYVKPHLHKVGQEPYRFLTGTKGEMNTGVVKNGKVLWNQPKEVGPGDEVQVQEGEVHSFRNNGEDPTDFLFACPDSHLIDNNPEHPDGDRYFTAGLEEATPPWYSTAAPKLSFY